MANFKITDTVLKHRQLCDQARKNLLAQNPSVDELRKMCQTKYTPKPTSNMKDKDK